MGAGLGLRDTSGAMNLANSLGLLGGALMDAQVAKEGRREKYATLVQQAIKSASPEDLKHLRSIELIGKYSNYDLTDNPYAVAAVEEAKGTFIRKEVQSKFEKEDLSIYKTAEESVSAYEAKLKEARKAVIGSSDDTFAFDKGIYENHPDDVLKVADKQRADKSEQVKQIAYASASSKAGEIALKALTTPPEDIIKATQELANLMRVQGNTWDTKNLRVFWDEFITNIAKSSGNSELLNSLKTVVVETDMDGQEHTIGEYVSYSDKFVTAGIRASHLQHQDFLSFVKEAEECATPEEVDKKYGALEQDPTRRTLFEALLPKRDSIKQTVIRRNEKQAKVNIASAADEQNMLTLNNVYTAQMEAFENGEFKTFGNFNTFGDVMYPHINSKGEVTLKKIKPEEATPLLEGYLTKIMADPNLDNNVKASRALKVLSHPSNKFYATQLGEKGLAQLTTMDEAVLPEGVQNLIFYREAGGSTFDLCFNDKVRSNIDAVMSLQDYYGKDKGLSVYIASREKLNDTDYQGTLKNAIKKERFSLTDFSNMWGDTEDISAETLQYEDDKVREQMRILMSTGMDKETAKNICVDTLRKNNYVYRGGFIPKAIFQGLDPVYAKEGLDYLVDDYKEKTGEDIVFTTWDSSNNRFAITSGGASPKFYTVENLINQYYVALSNHEEAIDSHKNNIDPVGKTRNTFVFSNYGDNTYNYDDNVEMQYNGRIIHE